MCTFSRSYVKDQESSVAVWPAEPRNCSQERHMSCVYCNDYSRIKKALSFPVSDLVCKEDFALFICYVPVSVSDILDKIYFL